MKIKKVKFIMIFLSAQNCFSGEVDSVQEILNKEPVPVIGDFKEGLAKIEQKESKEKSKISNEKKIASALVITKTKKNKSKKNDEKDKDKDPDYYPFRQNIKKRYPKKPYEKGINSRFNPDDWTKLPNGKWLHKICQKQISDPCNRLRHENLYCPN